MKILLIFLLSLSFSSIFSQARIDKKRIANKSQIYNRQAEERFALEVKTIDEFMERFNFAETTLIRQYLGVINPTAKPNRQQLLKTLFEAKTQIADSLKRKFIHSVCDSLNAEYLNFFQPDWFAEARCLFNQGSQHKYITLILRVQRTQNGGCKWVIAGAEEFMTNGKSKNVTTNSDYDGEKGLNPYSHVLNFTELEDAFADTKNINSYLDEAFITDRTKPILEAITTKKINFRYVQDIKYHFMQIDGWIFSVQQFKRMTRQAGWLISELHSANQFEKDSYKKSVLYLTNNQ
ncbi:hypothetical protein VB796_18495 [Arcicella sp. LKC2W]|uniref:hypothetical protein n=1 Tax=Arcicella sp. LKC2W TaxID=2984198 RepID=UPI002B21C6C2|nr:hypothetical protein [Arcicella sp. LKC2W]MEA5461058.1 hypothetical protein [Arcicella sp. LKC2W]